MFLPRIRRRAALLVNFKGSDDFNYEGAPCHRKPLGRPGRLAKEKGRPRSRIGN